MAKLTNILKEEDPCWKGYQQVGMKTKNGKQVPNCVPEGVVNEEQINELSADTYKNTIKAALQRGDSKGNSIAVKALQSFGKEIAKELAGKSFEVKGSMKDVTKALYKGSSYSYINQVKMTFTGEGSLMYNDVKVFGSDEVHFNMKVQFQLPDNIGGFSSDVKFRGYQNNKIPAIVQFSIKGGKVWVWFKGADTDLEFTRAGAREMAKLADTVVAAMDFPTKAKHNTIKQFDAMKPTNESVNESTPSDVIKDLDKAKNDLLKKVDALIAKKKKLYSDVDIEAPMSADEKKLDKDIADLFSQINKLVLQKRSVKKESVNEASDINSLKKIHDGILKFLKTKKGVGEVKELSEFPNRYGDNVSTFSVRYNIEDKYNYDSQEIKIEYSTSQVFIPNKGYFSFKTFNDIKNIINKKSALNESVNESSLSDIDIIAQEANDFKDFVKEFYKEYKDFPKTKESMKWLEGIYKNRSKTESLDKDGLERVAQGLPQTEEEPVNEDLRMGFRHIIHLIPTGYAPNDPKYKADLKYLRNTLNNFYKERGYDRTILPIY